MKPEFVKKNRVILCDYRTLWKGIYKVIVCHLNIRARVLTGVAEVRPIDEGDEDVADDRVRCRRSPC